MRSYQYGKNIKSLYRVYLCQKIEICYACLQSLDNQTIIEVNNSYGQVNYHLNCFKSDEPIQKHNIIIESNPNLVINIDYWLDIWNKKFPKSMIHRSVRYKLKPIKSICIKNKRAYIEIFKFLSIRKVISLANLCKRFYQVSIEPEIWKFFLKRDFGCVVETNDPRQIYIEIFWTHCSSCKKRFDEKYLYNSILRKKLCLTCTQNEKYESVSYTFLSNSFGCIVKYLNIKYFDYIPIKLTSWAKAYKKVIEYRESKKDFLLTLLTDDPIFGKLRDIVQKINVKKFEYINRTTEGRLKVIHNHPKTYNDVFKYVFGFINGRLKAISLEKLRKLILMIKFYYF